jgi:hypothetical protein
MSTSGYVCFKKVTNEVCLMHVVAIPPPSHVLADRDSLKTLVFSMP